MRVRVSLTQAREKNLMKATDGSGRLFELSEDLVTSGHAFFFPALGAFFVVSFFSHSSQMLARCGWHDESVHER